MDAAFLHCVADNDTAERDDMTTLLAKAGSNLTVKLLLDTLQEVLDFEASIAKKFVTPVCSLFSQSVIFLLTHSM